MRQGRASITYALGLVHELGLALLLLSSGVDLFSKGAKPHHLAHGFLLVLLALKFWVKLL